MAVPLPTSTSHAISDDDFLRFREFFYRKTGIMFQDNKRYFVDKRIQAQILSGGYASFRQYFDRVCFQADSDELQALVNVMTVNETYFYREEYQLKCLVRSILPEVVKTMGAGDTIKIWSMPCSTGEEPYSIAFYLLEHWSRVDDFNIEIVASDIDTDVLRKAKLGLYADRAVQHVSHDTVEKYMTMTRDGKFQVIDDLRNSIKFTQTNIIDAIENRFYRGFNVVFCRNLLIYFDDLSRREAAEAIFTALTPGGFVCLGHSESMSRISSLFELRKFPEAIVYQKPVKS
ncbi:CheR family methyltransferase [Lichenifustis flavocetrariae]|uniref:Chemotaxis protein methyltransferase n=1 Tax=Lichenifustis flavocetrariae TaxID=2949735 RepID=A0AA41Z9Q4_9HYPH|nr:protein-glutamate O-methyltransferase CheR [Lichenifustis flavocetrariae]MCW6512880.1 protein-glutamate O-methyltransferase CheR [Lichenifustis flavocetrariae]